MGYPERLLSDDEIVESQFRPHWSGILREGLILLGGIALAVVFALFDAPLWAYLVLAGIVILLVVAGIVRWVNTLHVITNERLIYRAGFIAKRGTEIPLEVIQNVAFGQTILERVFGTGDLMIESAGTHGQTRYRDIPNPEGVQALIYKVREIRMAQVESGRGAAFPDSNDTVASLPSEPESTASQLERLSRLHDQGKLTDAEFQAQKAKLLGGGA
ncbi:MAG TPA: PH domain-containing protein [Acidimicrobiia bacterium]|nr:PH domain-containing protein [Acidimicrobiia bacterium]